MYAFFDKHGKKALAVAAALLILGMALPQGAGRMGSGASGHLGTLNGEALDPVAVDNAMRSLEVLERIEVNIPQAGEVTLPPAMFGPELSRAFRDDPRLYYLLVHEAEASGVAPNEADVSELLRDQGTKIRLPQGESRDFASIEQANPSYAQAVQDSLRAALSVVETARQSTRSIKISTPLVRQAMARRTQEIRIHVLSFDSAALAAKLPKPSDAQLAEQFNAYAAIAPGATDTKLNPFAFGYRVPDRIRLDYIEIPTAEIERVVIASKAPEDWEEEAQLAYLREPARYAAAPSTQPTTRTAATQATQPTTRPFVEARADVLKALRQPLIEQRRHAVLNRIQQQLTGDYQAASDKGVATTQKVEAATPSFGVPVSSFDYLQKIRDTVQRQFGVGVRVVREPNLFSQSELSLHPSLGAAKTEAAGNDLPKSAAQYLFENLKPLKPEAVAKIGLYEPSKTLVSDDSLFVVRATAVDPSHAPATMADVKGQVEKDVRRKLAFEQATRAANAALQAAATGGLSKAGPNMATSGWFKESDFTIPGLDEKAAGSDSYLLVGPSFDLLRGVKSQGDLPVRSVVPLASSNRVCVVELFDLRSTQTAEETALMSYLTASQLQQVTAQQEGYPKSWYDRDAVFKRVGFVPAEPAKRKPDQGTPPPSAPAGPFIPG